MVSRWKMKTTSYFDKMRSRPDRAMIKIRWIKEVINNPQYKTTQTDRRIRLWAKIPEMNNRYLRVILLPDKETVHNAFFDRSFDP